ncbi:putative phosphonate catabolism associated alcohol dehydrogenase [Cyclobacterium xiamenense]|uniref:Putative phosphonate catabolism associated alcohol dehydrogenase n=1 Tax=Cyclobacterium xiamenense TaxID=1297121 RepID=A0A1H6U4B3_9BACT|nr:zinc-binding dehydrogenase [Cyclobacterium xiamenense]SEI83240.1 putative phosphonate catabolism associated alcohol dehydrogenase [Cyclobacterium xiamenense]
MNKGRLIAFNGPGTNLEIRSETLGELDPASVLVKNLVTTICGSDLHTFTGVRKEPCPVVLGHEIVGTIVEIGSQHSGRDYSGEKLEPGDLVTWTIFSSDPSSQLAKEGIPQKGADLFKYGHAQLTEKEQFHGGLSEFCVLKPGTGILKLPKELPLELAATVNCAVSTAAGAVRLSGNPKGKRVLIFGAGMLGITCAAMCRDAGAKWVGMVDVSSERLNRALKFGVDAIFESGNRSVALLAELAKTSSGKGMDRVFDMSGAPEAMEVGLGALGIGGVAVWVGAVFATRNVQVNPENLIRKLITIRGLHNYNYEDFVYGLDFMRRNWQRFPFVSVVEKTFDFEQAEEAFAYALAHKPLRVAIRIHPTI